MSLASSTVLAQATQATRPAATKPTVDVPALTAEQVEQARTAKAWEAAPKLNKDGSFNEGFYRSHQSFLARGNKGEVGLLLLGDSITAGWGRPAKIFKETFGEHKPANFGIGGDRTQHVLWRIANGELDAIRPKVIMLMIGTNNIGSPADEIARGVTTVVEAIRAKRPESRILLLGIFPRGAKPTDPRTAAMREKITQINAELARLDDGRQVKYLDIGAVFTDENGVLTKEVMPDALHLSNDGYQRWADAVKPVIDEMMK